MVLNLRLLERAEFTVQSAFGSCEAFETFLNQGTCWLFEEAERRYLNRKWVEFPPSTVLLSGTCKIVLARPRPSTDNFYNEIRYVILAVRTASRDDRVEALKAREVDEPIRIFDHDLLPAGLTDTRTRTTLQQPTLARSGQQLKTEHDVKENDATTAAQQESEGETKDKQHFIITAVCPQCNKNLAPGRGTYCQHCGLELPSDLAVHPEVVVAIKRSAYDKLATHLKQKVNVAWSQLLRGRQVDKSLNSMGQALFIITVQDERRTSSQTDEQRLDSILTETNVGRVATDRYELREAHRMMDRKPSARPV
jgi:hypothetical protein